MVSPAGVKKNKGWFLGVGRDGDRTLEQQMAGLERLVAEVRGKSVIDAGCAEGLISMELAKAGAQWCVGVEVVQGHVEIANGMKGNLPCAFKVGNLNDFDVSTLPMADVVIMLAILHKLKDPSGVCAQLAARAKDLCVIRLTPHGPVIIDDRSKNVPHDILQVMDSAGFALEWQGTGSFSEWIGYFRRVNVIEAVPPAPVTEVVAASPAPTELVMTTATVVQAEPETQPADAATGTEAPSDEPKAPETETEAAESATTAPETGTPAEEPKTPARRGRPRTRTSE